MCREACLFSVQKVPESRSMGEVRCVSGFLHVQYAKCVGCSMCLQSRTAVMPM